MIPVTAKPTIASVGRASGRLKTWASELMRI
jgi:hypothetical protein